MLSVGLTGGLASGKSTVAKLFNELGTIIIDADKIARDVVTIGSVGLEQVEQQFGTACLLADGSLNRAYLRELIFKNAHKKQLLENITHPLIYAEIKRLMQLQSEQAYIIIEIPLLIETQMQALVEHIIVVDCLPEQQIQRALVRNALSKDTIQAIMATQVSREQRLEYADSIIDNSDNTSLVQQVNFLHSHFMQYAL